MKNHVLQIALIASLIVIGGCSDGRDNGATAGGEQNREADGTNVEPDKPALSTDDNGDDAGRPGAAGNDDGRATDDDASDDGDAGAGEDETPGDDDRSAAGDDTGNGDDDSGHDDDTTDDETLANDDDETPATGDDDNNDSGAEDDDDQPPAYIPSDDPQGAGDATDGDPPQTANIIPTYEHFLGTGADYAVLIGSAGSQSWFRSLAVTADGDVDDSGIVRRTLLTPLEYLFAVATPPADDIRLYQYSRCIGDLADCIDVVAPTLPPIPLSPAVMIANDYAEWGLFRLDPPESITTGLPSMGTGVIGYLTAEGAIDLTLPELEGGPDHGRVLTRDQFVWVLKKVIAWHRNENMPYWGSDESIACACECPPDFVGNEGDPGLDEFMADYVEGAGAAASPTTESFPLSEERLARMAAAQAKCQEQVDARGDEESAETLNGEYPASGTGIITDHGDVSGLPAPPEQFDDTCGNYTVDWLPEGFSAPPACPNPGTITTINSLAALQTWAANPVTSAKITANIDFGGGNPAVVTNCDVLTAAWLP